MKLKIIFFCYMLFTFSSCLQANDRYLTQILNIFEASNFDIPEKNELAQKLSDDLCVIMKNAKDIDDIPDFLYKSQFSWHKGKGFYKVIYHVNSSGELEVKSWVSSHKNTVLESIDIEKLSKPIDFDISTISEEEILHGLMSELAKIDVDNELKEAIFPVLQQDLSAKLSSKCKEDLPLYPRFLGGIADYLVDFYRAEDGKIDVYTRILYRNKHNDRIELRPFPYPLDFDYSKITEEEIATKLAEIFEQPAIKKQLVEEYVLKKSDCDILMQQIVSDLKLRFSSDGSRFNVPDFLGGVSKYNVDFYMTEQADKTKAPFLSASGYRFSGEKNTIKFKKAGPWKTIMLR